MSSRILCEGDRVERIYVKGAGDAAFKRTYPGTVIDVGKKGVQVRFDDPKQGVQWVPNNAIRVIEPAKPDSPARVRSPLTQKIVIPASEAKEAAPEPTAPESERPKSALRVPPPVPPAPDLPPSAPAGEERSRADRDLDALADMAKALVERCWADVQQAQASVREAETQYNDACAVLAEVTARYERAAKMAGRT